MSAYLIQSQGFRSLYYSMSYAYRSEFIDNILQIRAEVLDELTHEAHQMRPLEQSGRAPNPNRQVDSEEDIESHLEDSRADISDSEMGSNMHRLESNASFDAQEFINQRSQKLDQFFRPIYE
jgi:hypothetical protein